MLTHAGKCKWSNEFKVDRILACRGKPWARQYKIRWDGYSEKWDTWEPRSHLHPEAIADFEKANDLYDHDWLHRCDICDLPCKSDRGVRIHKSAKHRNETTQNFKGRLADDAVKAKKWEAQQAVRAKVICQGVPVENVYKFIYLGGVLAADARQDYDIDRRIAMAMSRCGRLRNIFDSQEIGP